MKLVKNEIEKTTKSAVSDKEAEEAFIKIIKWIGEDSSANTLNSGYSYLTLSRTRLSTSKSTSVTISDLPLKLIFFSVRNRSRMIVPASLATVMEISKALCPDVDTGIATSVSYTHLTLPTILLV